jgi:hypothetical protein
MRLIAEKRLQQMNEGNVPCFATIGTRLCGQVGCSHLFDCKQFDEEINQIERYKMSLFGHILDPIERKDAMKNALMTALDIRRFEIQLYWERAKYFWVFLAAIFAGFFWTLQQSPVTESIENMMLILACMGLTTSCAWFMVLKGSKYWQENWEKHVDYLEANVNGYLYSHCVSGKSVAKKQSKLNAYPISVSKVNLMLCLAVLWFWICAVLGVYVQLFHTQRIYIDSYWSWIIHDIAILSATVFILLVWRNCKTSNAKRIMSEKDFDFVSRREFDAT